MKTLVAFVSGVVLTLMLAGIGWYLWVQPLSEAKTPMGDMAGMSMSQQSSDGSGEGVAQAAVMVSPARRQLIGIKTDIVQVRLLKSAIRTVGTVDYNERGIRQINLRVSGWITGLSADSTGKRVNQGAPLLTLYSPDLVSTQEEYLLAKRTLERVGGQVASTSDEPMLHVRTGAEAQIESAKNRLLLWGLTKDQISQLEQRGTPQRETTIYSTIDGVVTKKMALQGMYVTPEMNLYEIADLSTVWISPTCMNMK